MDDIDIIPSTVSALARRRALRGAAIGGLGVALGATRAARAQDMRAAGTPTDDEILNFALNFEYLGAELYLRALTGSGLDAADIGGLGTPGPVRGGRPVLFRTDVIRDVVGKLAADELAHVRTVRARLGRVAVARPAINLTVEWWTAIATAAGAIEQGRRFDPYADEIAFLKAAYVLEDVCVTALAGALPLFTRGEDVAAASGFLGVEAAQASAIRVLLALNNQGRFTDAISALRAKLSGAPDDVGTTVGANTVNFVSSSKGQVFARTPAQVLAVAYGGGAASDYGFFPNRVNGVIS